MVVLISCFWGGGDGQPLIGIWKGRTKHLYVGVVDFYWCTLEGINKDRTNHNIV